MGQVQPALGGLQGVRALTVLDLGYHMIMAGVDDFLLLHYGVFHRIYESPAYASAAAGIDEAVLGTGIEGIFTVHELGMQAYVALLAAGLQVRKPFPVHEVLGAGYAAGGGGG